MAKQEVPCAVHVEERKRRLAASLLRLMRVHQWVKNLLVFVPLLAAHALRDPGPVRASIVAFLAFSFCASGIYAINDIHDAEADREHHQKRHRPVASGEVTSPQALMLAVLLLAAGASLGRSVSPHVLRVIAAYVSLSVAYSYVLKEIAIVDVLTLAGLYTLRVLVGGAATGIELSPWLLAFSMFLFISLAIVKRVSELRDVRDSRQERISRRSYGTADLDVLSVIGASAGQMAVLVMALYIHSENVSRVYRRPDILWLLCVVVFYWIARVWLKLHRGQIHQDPVVYALRDGASYVVGILALLIVYLAAR